MESKLFLVISLTATVLSAGLPSEAASIRVRRSAIVDCGAYRRPIVREVRLNGRDVERVVCVNTPRHARAIYTRPAHRSWKKSALVIGGSSAAGAGIGALVGGKKGALVGGIAGGAAGTAYEVHKRRALKRRRVLR